MDPLIRVKWLVHERSTGNQTPNLSTKDVLDRLRIGSLKKEDLVWKQGQENWIEIDELVRLLDRETRSERTVSPANDAARTQPISTAPRETTKSKVELHLRDDLSGRTTGIDTSDKLLPKDQTTSEINQAASGYTQQTSPTLESNVLVEGGATQTSPIEGGPPQSSNAPSSRFSSEETGTVTFYDARKKRGYILIEGKGRLSFSASAMARAAPREIVGSRVLCAVVTTDDDAIATSIRILESPNTPPSAAEAKKIFQNELSDLSRRRVKPGELLTRWSNLAVNPTEVVVDGVTQSRDDIAKLARLCLTEPWCFEYDKDRDDYSILRKYIRYTFYRVFKEEKIAFTQTHATFNTGLVDHLFEPIYALFVRNTRAGSRPYRFADFCVVGDEGSGKELMARFSLPERPEPAQYMTNFDEVIFNHRCAVTPQPKHVMDDAIAAGRYPIDFLLRHLPPGVRGQPNNKDRTWLMAYVTALNANPKHKRAFASDLRYAIEFAKKRARWNYKTAIPNYFPTANRMSLLLPLALLDESTPDLALVCNRVNEHEYYGVTVYPLDMAYESARLVCRPLSDWLTPEIANASDVDEDLETEGETEEKHEDEAGIVEKEDLEDFEEKEGE